MSEWAGEIHALFSRRQPLGYVLSTMSYGSRADQAMISAGRVKGKEWQPAAAYHDCYGHVKDSADQAIYHVIQPMRSRFS